MVSVVDGGRRGSVHLCNFSKKLGPGTFASDMVALAVCDCRLGKVQAVRQLVGHIYQLALQQQTRGVLDSTQVKDMATSCLFPVSLSLSRIIAF